ncbi:MAG: ArsC/Spx/MgsR family protein, partial [Arenimonas sp.]
MASPTSKAVIYHNTKCSKSNAALNLLLEHDVDVEIINYLETPLTSSALCVLLQQLDLDAKQIIRFGEPLAAELAIAIDDIRDENEWLAILARHPILIERPIVVINGKAVVARPTETILGLLQ